MENVVKPKSIIIDGDIHKDFKLFCKGKNLKIGGVVEDLIELYMNETLAVRKLIDSKITVNG